MSLKGVTATRLTVGERDIDVRVLVRRQDRSSIEKIRDLTLITDAGSSWSVGDLAHIEKTEAAPYLTRRDRRDVVAVKVSGGTEDPGQWREAVSAVTRKDENAVLRQRSVFHEHFPQVILSFSLSILLLYLVLGAQLESFYLPLLLMLSFPLSFSGILVALVAAGSSINLSSALGIIVLLGISVNNAIILFETYRRSIHPAVDIADTLEQGSVRRLRPILMTSITTVAAMVPIAVDPWQRSPQSSLAIAIIGGLLFSTLLSLFVIPTVFLAYLRKKNEAPS
jgi:HAE1 family hydrophobic/amphiphilic exporter-1